MPNKEKYSCKKCSKSFSDKNQLGGHIGSHNRYTGMILKNRGIYYYCLNCRTDITHLGQKKRKRLYCNEGCMRQYRDKTTYIFGITKSALNKYREKHPVCEICSLEERVVHANNKSRKNKLAVDHDHKTGKFRGLLCSSCNRNLNWAENKFSQIEKYLSK